MHADGKLHWVRIPQRISFHGGRVWMTGASYASVRTQPDGALIKALRTAHRIAKSHSDAAGLLQQAPADPYERIVVQLAYLSPDLQQAILEGTQPQGFRLERVKDAPIPFAWGDQRRALPQTSTTVAENAPIGR